MALRRLWQAARGQVEEEFFMAFAGDEARTAHGPEVLVALRRRAGLGVDVAERFKRHRRDKHPVVNIDCETTEDGPWWSATVVWTP